MKKLLVLIMSFSLMLVTLTACEDVGHEKVDPDVHESKEKGVDKIEDPEAPQRTVAGTIAVVEILDALGVNMVGIPNSDRFKDEKFDDIPRIGMPMKPDMEKIKSLDPDIFVTVTTLQASLEEPLKNSNIDSLFINNDSYESIIDTIQLFGEIYNRQERADEVISEMREKEEKILAKIKGQKNPRVMIIFGTPQKFTLATQNSYTGGLVKKLKGVNITEELGDFDENYIPLNMEEILVLQPDIILRLTHVNPDDSRKAFEKEFSENEFWQKFKAVQDGKVYDLDNKYFGVSGSIDADTALEEMAKLLYDVE